MDDHFLDINETSDDFNITDTLKRSIHKFSSWVRILAILGLIIVTLGLIVDVALLFEASRREYAREEQVFIAFILFTALVIVALISIFALQYVRITNRAFKERSVVGLEKAYGRLSIVVILASFLFFLISAFGFFIVYIIIDSYSNRYY